MKRRDVLKESAMKQLNSINEVMHYNQEQVKIAQAGYNAGSLLRTDLLQAKIDSSNTTLLSFHKQIDITRLFLKENNKLYSPVVNFTGGYYYSLSNSSSGSVLNNSSFGPQLGGTLTIPIYSSGENKRKITTAKIQLQSAEYDFRNIELQVNTEFQNALTGFENQQKLLQIEKENNELTRENLQISLQRLRLGQTTSLEVHLAQENFVLSCTRLINFEYNLKITETKLKQLIASL